MFSLILINFLEKLFSIIFLIMGLPFILLIFFILFFFQGRPVIYLSKRVGKNGVEFTIYKFRTMENKYSKHDDDKITKIGNYLRKLSIDEILQIFNVLKGDMSFVGPRPLPKEIEQQLSHNQLTKRRAHKPGITGLSQINYRPNRSLAEKIDLDLYFIDNFSFSLYLVIFLKTIPTVIKKFFKN